jgi:serine/threonine protein kinase
LDLWALGCLLYELIFGKPLFLKARGIQQLGSLIFRLFENQFSQLQVPAHVLEHIIKDCPIIEDSVKEIKENFTWLRNEHFEIWSLLEVLLSVQPAKRLQFENYLTQVFSKHSDFESVQTQESNLVEIQKFKKIKKEAVLREQKFSEIFAALRESDPKALVAKKHCQVKGKKVRELSPTTLGLSQTGSLFSRLS